MEVRRGEKVGTQREEERGSFFWRRWRLVHGRDIERRKVGFCGGASDVVHGGVGKK